MIKNIWILIGKKLSGEASPEELLELEELLAQSPADQYELSALEEIWKAGLPNGINDDLESRWAAFQTKLKQIESSGNHEAEQSLIERGIFRPNIIKLIKYTSLTAACVLILLFFYNKKNVLVSGKPNEIIAPQHKISKIQLADGSTVWLNSGSKLVYASNYGAEFRKVYLTGEALFDVVKDTKHPFIVTTSTISIKVLGTRFNVRAYKNDKSCETSLIRGRIQLTVLKNPEKQIILKASEKLVVTNNEPRPVHDEALANNLKNNVAEEVPLIALSRVHQAKQDTLPSEALWVDGKLAFDAEDFETLALRLEQRYGVSIIFKNNGLKKIRFTGKFQNEPISKVLKDLQATTNFHYKTNNNQILIY